MRKDLDVTNNQPIDKDELNDLIEYFINEINSDDDDGNYFDPESGFEIDEQIIPQKVVIEEEQSETESESFDTSSVEFHLAGTLKYLKDPSQYMPDIDDDYDFDDDADDNQITLGSYYWQERCEINNIDEIVDRIRAEIDKKKAEQKKQLTQKSKNDDYGGLYHEFLQAYASDPQNKANKKIFIEKYMDKNVNEMTMTNAVKNFKEKNQIEMNFNIFSYSTLQKKQGFLIFFQHLEKKNTLKMDHFHIKKEVQGKSQPK